MNHETNCWLVTCSTHQVTFEPHPQVCKDKIRQDSFAWLFEACIITIAGSLELASGICAGMTLYYLKFGISSCIMSQTIHVLNCDIHLGHKWGECM